MNLQCYIRSIYSIRNRTSDRCHRLWLYQNKKLYLRYFARVFMVNYVHIMRCPDFFLIERSATVYTLSWNELHFPPLRHNLNFWQLDDLIIIIYNIINPTTSCSVWCQPTQTKHDKRHSKTAHHASSKPYDVSEICVSERCVPTRRYS